MTVRDFITADRDAVVTLWHSVFGASFSGRIPIPERAVFEGYFAHNVLALHRIWVACRGDTICGFASATEFELHNLFVAPSFQRRGVGAALLSRALERFPKLRQVRTLVENGKARDFYARRGFRYFKTVPSTFQGKLDVILVRYDGTEL